jgi:hypothetical protein
MMWNNVNWQRLTRLLILVSGVAVIIQWLFERSLSPASIWGYLGTASIVFFIGLSTINKRLWRLRIMKWRVFGWISNMPDISGEWEVEMKPRWKHPEPFSSRATIRQNLFSVQVVLERGASRSQSLTASIFSTDENQWRLACVYANEAKSAPEEYTVDHHYGCFLLSIENPDSSKRMGGPYWTNKKTTVPISQLSDLQGPQVPLNQFHQGSLPGMPIPVSATSGYVTFTRSTQNRLSDSASISPV